MSAIVFCLFKILLIIQCPKNFVKNGSLIFISLWHHFASASDKWQFNLFDTFLLQILCLLCHCINIFLHCAQIYHIYHTLFYFSVLHILTAWLWPLNLSCSTASILRGHQERHCTTLHWFNTRHVAVAAKLHHNQLVFNALSRPLSSRS